MNCPLLVPGLDFSAVGRWPVVTRRNIAAVIGYDLGARYRFYSGDRLLAHHDGGTVILRTGYACDGYSPVIPYRVMGRWHFVRLTPTPAAGMFPAILHDFARQFCDIPKCPWDRLDTDAWFYDSLVAGGCNKHLAGTYYGAVAGVAGDIFIAMSRRPDPQLWIEKIPYS